MRGSRTQQASSVPPRSFDAFRADEQVSLLWSFAVLGVQWDELQAVRGMWKMPRASRVGKKEAPPWPLEALVRWFLSIGCGGEEPSRGPLTCWENPHQLVHDFELKGRLFRRTDPAKGTVRPRPSTSRWLPGWEATQVVLTFFLW